MGAVMSNEAVKNAATFQDSLQNLQTSIQGIKQKIMADFLPSLTGIMDGLTLIFSGNEEGGLALIN
nr:MAG TPA: tail tape measure [Caudoviricetes sp.]